MGLAGRELSLPSTLVRVSTGLLQADSGATLAECFFMMTSSDGLSSKPLRLHPWSWFGADTRPLDGTLDVSRAGLRLSVPSHPSNSLLMFFFYLCRFPPPPSFPHLPSLLKSAVPGVSRLVSPHVQFGNCCNSLTSHIHQPPPTPTLEHPPTVPRQAWPLSLNESHPGPVWTDDTLVLRCCCCAKRFDAFNLDIWLIHSWNPCLKYLSVTDEA